MNDFEALGYLFIILSTLGAFTFIVGIGLYILWAYGLYKMAQNSDIENEWFAIIPILQLYTFGKLIEKSKLGQLVPNLPLVMVFAPLGYWLLSMILGFIPILGWILNIVLFLAYIAFEITAVFYLYAKYSKNVVIMLIASIILPFLAPIFVFIIRNNNIKES